MNLDSLKQAIGARSFWPKASAKALLPDQNLMRESYLTALDQLEGVNIVTSIMGQRRCGKSVVSRQYIERLWHAGIPRKNILYINFFLKATGDISKESQFMAITEWWIKECVDPDKPCYMLLDEVHELENWDEQIASLFEDPLMPCRLIITGSNSKILSEELSTKLGGRYTTLQVFPFSFSEYCQFVGVEPSLQQVEPYLNTGGMPEVLKIQGAEQRQQLISDIINSTISHDIVARYNPSNPKLLYALIDFCRLSFSQELSIKKISNSVFEQQTVATKQTHSSLIETYIGYMQDVYFLYTPQTYSYRNKEVLKRSVNKIYLGDLCMANYKPHTQQGRLLENMVYLELIRRHFKVQRFLGYRNRNLEIDFFAEKNHRTVMIQVCWQLGDQEENTTLWEREFGNLHHTRSEAEKWLVSLDSDVVSPYKGIEAMDIIKFLRRIEQFE